MKIMYFFDQEPFKTLFAYRIFMGIDGAWVLVHYV